MQHRCTRTDQRTGTRRIGPDVYVCDQSAGGVVHVYATRSGGSERAQMARDLSVMPKEGGGYFHNGQVLPMPFSSGSHAPRGGCLNPKGFTLA